MSSRMDDTADSPRTVDEARDAVERSRQRISSTLDTLEDRIVEKKHELKDRADVLRPVRDRITARPLVAVAVAVGVGALLGRLGGGPDADADVRRGRSGRVRGTALADRDRAELRRWRRSRRERLRSMTGENGRRDHTDDDAGGHLDGLKQQLMGALTTAISAAVAARVREFAASSLGGTGRGDGQRGRRR